MKRLTAGMREAFRWLKQSVSYLVHWRITRLRCLLIVILALAVCCIGVSLGIFAIVTTLPPTPTSSTPTPPPPPKVTITSPADGSKVPMVVLVQGTAFNIPSDKDLWVFVEAGGGFFPQGNAQNPRPVMVSTDGKWNVTAYVGLPSQVGEQFILAAALADKDGTARIKANLALGTFPPLDSMDGISIITQVSVVRT
jgi:hypothetical protein